MLVQNSNQPEDVFNRYVIGAVLGKGESCTVYSAVDAYDNNLPVAMKIIDVSTEYCSKDKATAISHDTKREVELLRLCSGHKNIVTFYFEYWINTYIILTFERCSVDLFEYMHDRVTLDEWQSSKLIYELLSALEFVHAQKIIHRDIKAENILLTSNMDLRLTDFGISCFFPPEGRLLTEVIGTPGYLAPEMAFLTTRASRMQKNAGYHKEIDIWSSGIMLYLLLTGCPPFWFDNLTSLFHSILNDDIASKLNRYELISVNAQNLILKLLVKNPKDRSSLSEALEMPFCKLHLNQTRESFHADKDVIGDFAVKTLKEIPNPYNLSLLKEIIDTSSFSLFKHWIVNEDNSKNRASFYQENFVKDDMNQ